MNSELDPVFDWVYTSDYPLELLFYGLIGYEWISLVSVMAEDDVGFEIRTC